MNTTRIYCTAQETIFNVLYQTIMEKRIKKEYRYTHKGMYNQILALKPPLDTWIQPCLKPTYPDL